MTIEWIDRYMALGIPYPDPKTMCKGQCEGTGVYPHRQPDGDFKFVKCEDCDGTGYADKRRRE